MGIGEPLDNLDNVLTFFELSGIGARHISLSTCGVVPGIVKLADSGWPVTLSVSIHAPRNDLRDKLMPVNETYPLEELIPACRQYFSKTGRRVSYEYAIIKGFNDSEVLAGELAALLPKPAHVNLIPVNPVRGLDSLDRIASMRRKDETSCKSIGSGGTRAFATVLKDNGISCTVRRTLGGDIGAACGQLRGGKA
jgi:23S rRNA (adenine2503-C2)-methyltransferase